ncbi:hypothetical protein HPB48_014082 [Haemaphysalis longicornis]|uniref:GB1/RHD3-type G domain-containing protein n=1 Tax=Haemaphysalis longicornis TaxID=44386 RepID=A0A9J6H196_HAELO|nr:hypothetical protein HPB48_014082 [Haemaphysalis longicornis]
MTSRRVTGGQAVQIFSRRDGGGFELNEEKLREILLHPDVQDKPVVVISVAGAFRKGKSFLLNIFLRYMHNGEQDDWLGSASTPLEGFSWSHGAEGHTMGILVWDELFLVRTPCKKALPFYNILALSGYQGRRQSGCCSTHGHAGNV